MAGSRFDVDADVFSMLAECRRNISQQALSETNARRREWTLWTERADIVLNNE